MSKVKAFEKKVKQAIVGVTPGVQIQAFHKGKKKIDLDIGETFPYYDLASLTKVISTVGILMKLHDQKKWDLTKPISHYIPWSKHTVKSSQLLTHSAGLPWWQPFYQKIDLDWSFEERKYAIYRELRTLLEETPEKAVYSDVDFLFLGAVIEYLTERPLDVHFLELSSELGLKDTFYHRDNKPVFDKKKYAPTENCAWRKHLLKGEVHDENAWVLGGVAPHAGLFGSIEDVSRWALSLRTGLRGGNCPWKSSTLKLFTKRAISPKMGDWALGFMMPTLKTSSSGQYFSPLSFGHTGFTGTSVWFDPKSDFIVVILSNRIHPTRHNEEFRSLRPKLHDWCYELCVGVP